MDKALLAIIPNSLSHNNLIDYAHFKLTNLELGVLLYYILRLLQLEQQPFWWLDSKLAL